MSKQALAEFERVPDRTTDARAARILARSLFRDMRSNGYGCQPILALATELIDLVTREMRGEGDTNVRTLDLPAAVEPPLKVAGRV